MFPAHRSHALMHNVCLLAISTLVMKGDTLYRPDELYKAVGVKPFLDSSNF